MEVRELGKKTKNTLPPAEREEKIKKMRKEDEKLVDGRFEFVDAQGGWFEFAYRKYPGEPILMIKLIHDEKTALPMGLVKHLNNTVRKIRKYNIEMPESGGRPIRSFTTQSRVRFIPESVM